MTKRYNNYAEKKEAQKSGIYEGNSPYFKNIPEFQFLKPIHKNLYPHLRQWPGFRLPNAPQPWNQQRQQEVLEYED